MEVEQCFSDWRSVTYGLVQALLLALCFFQIYINNMNVKVGGMMSNFVDNTNWCCELVGRLSKVRTEYRIKLKIGRLN